MKKYYPIYRTNFYDSLRINIYAGKHPLSSALNNERRDEKKKYANILSFSINESFFP